jgi:predicted chitinase
MSLANPSVFFDRLRAGLLGPVLSPTEVSGCNAILEAMEGAPLSWTAYALATAYHETASTMQPIREYGGVAYLTRMYDPTGARPQLAVENGNSCPGDGVKYAGRGYVQLTWKNNYAKAGHECGVNLVANPNLALEPDIAAKIMRSGMEEGWFTGRKFSDYLPAHGPADERQFALARHIINGSDRALQIAGHALAFQSALEAGGWQ